MFTEIRDYPAVVPSLHDFTVRICDCKMASQNLYTPGSQVQTQRTFMQFLPCVCIVLVYTCEGQTNASMQERLALRFHLC